ncbi:hypothetical protein KIV45_22320 [Janthinobacterium lividum]|nr:hypothetical protein KIV45_22320 [Janthinobacterium lividum]
MNPHSSHARAACCASSLPVRERLRLARLASKKVLSVLSALLCAAPLLYLLSVVLFAQP